MVASKTRISKRATKFPRETPAPSHSLKLGKPSNGTIDIQIGEHKLVEIKRLPDSLISLQKELAAPQNRDLMISAQKGKDFNECIGIIAADLGIMLDGFYDIPPLCDMLVAAIKGRGTFNTASIHNAHPSLIPIMRLDTTEGVTIEDRAEGLVSIKQATGGEGPYTICGPCNTSFECCTLRDCKRGKPAFQLGNSLDIAKKILKGLH